MPLAGLLILFSVTAPPQVAVHPDVGALARSAGALHSQWRGGDLERCPEGVVVDSVSRRLIEVPETLPRLADKTGGRPGWVPPPAPSEPCVAPAGR